MAVTEFPQGAQRWSSDFPPCQPHHQRAFPRHGSPKGQGKRGELGVGVSVSGERRRYFTRFHGKGVAFSQGTIRFWRRNAHTLARTHTHTDQRMAKVSCSLRMVCSEWLFTAKSKTRWNRWKSFMRWTLGRQGDDCGRVRSNFETPLARLRNSNTSAGHVRFIATRFPFVSRIEKDNTSGTICSLTTALHSCHLAIFTPFQWGSCF